MEWNEAVTLFQKHGWQVETEKTNHVELTRPSLIRSEAFRALPKLVALFIVAFPILQFFEDKRYYESGLFAVLFTLVVFGILALITSGVQIAMIIMAQSTNTERRVVLTVQDNCIVVNEAPKPTMLIENAEQLLTIIRPLEGLTITEAKSLVIPTFLKLLGLACAVALVMGLITGIVSIFTYLMR